MIASRFASLGQDFQPGDSCFAVLVASEVPEWADWRPTDFSDSAPAVGEGFFAITRPSTDLLTLLEYIFEFNAQRMDAAQDGLPSEWAMPVLTVYGDDRAARIVMFSGQHPLEDQAN